MSSSQISSGSQSSSGSSENNNVFAVYVFNNINSTATVNTADARLTVMMVNTSLIQQLNNLILSSSSSSSSSSNNLSIIENVARNLVGPLQNLNLLQRYTNESFIHTFQVDCNAIKKFLYFDSVRLTTEQNQQNQNNIIEIIEALKKHISRGTSDVICGTTDVIFLTNDIAINDPKFNENFIAQYTRLVKSTLAISEKVNDNITKTSTYGRNDNFFRTGSTGGKKTAKRHHKN
jgi:hypothetical protein